jgi:hypothetical protein
MSDPAREAEIGLFCNALVVAQYVKYYFLKHRLEGGGEILMLLCEWITFPPGGLNQPGTIEVRHPTQRVRERIITIRQQTIAFLENPGVNVRISVRSQPHDFVFIKALIPNIVDESMIEVA